MSFLPAETTAHADNNRTRSAEKKRKKKTKAQEKYDLIEISRRSPVEEKKRTSLNRGRKRTERKSQRNLFDGEVLLSKHNETPSAYGTRWATNDNPKKPARIFLSGDVSPVKTQHTLKTTARDFQARNGYTINEHSRQGSPMTSFSKTKKFNVLNITAKDKMNETTSWEGSP